MSEILAPAGSFEALKAAINAGCDAVYIGGSRFSARSYATNFDDEVLKEAILYAHLQGVKVYYALNTMIKEHELTEALEDLWKAYQLGIDAVILQDLGLAKRVQKIMPDLECHGSTQMTVHSLSGVQYLESCGFSRVVLSRELSLEEIEYISNHTHVALEVFVHGALCYSYSGKCLMSSYIGGRSGNRGRCAQTCRLAYQIKEQDRISEKGYLLSPKDIMSLEVLDRLLKAGVASFKIEGRMKSPEYVGKVVSIYKKYRDQCQNGNFLLESTDIMTLKQLFNRGGFTKGYLEPDKTSMLSGIKPNHQGIEIGTVKATIKPDYYEVKVIKEIHKGDTLVINTKNHEKSFIIDRDISVGLSKLKIYGPKLKAGTKLYRITDQRLMSDIHRDILDKNMDLGIHGILKAYCNKPISLELRYKDYCIMEQGELVEKAMNEPVSKEWIELQLKKTGNTPVYFDMLDIQKDSDIFIPLKVIKGLRRKAIDHLIEIMTEWYPDRGFRTYAESESYNGLAKKDITNCKKELTVLLRKRSQYEIIKDYSVDRVILDMAFLSEADIESIISSSTCQVYIQIPDILRQEHQSDIESQLKKWSLTPISGVVVGSYDGLLLANNIGCCIICGDGILVYNNEMINRLSDMDGFHFAKELSLQSLKGLNKEKGIAVVYGYQQVMVSAQCAYKDSFGCNKQSGYYELIDRKDNTMKVFKDCHRCTNYLFNAYPTYLLDKQKEYESIGIRNFRIDFLDESEDEVRDIMEAFFENKTPDEVGLEAFTRGHFKKGVL